MLQSEHLFTEKFTRGQVELKGKCVWGDVIKIVQKRNSLNIIKTTIKIIEKQQWKRGETAY